jgi:hypothetical protein
MRNGNILSTIKEGSNFFPMDNKMANRRYINNIFGKKYLPWITLRRQGTGVAPFATWIIAPKNGYRKSLVMLLAG